MPEREEKAKLLGIKKFSNKEYSIKIKFYDHQMAYADIDDKLRWRRRQKKNEPWMTFLYFDECTIESMYDYFDCLDTLKYDKVARRWFMRQLRYCTDGLLRPNGYMDSEKVYERMYQNEHRTTNRYNYSFKDSRKALPPERLTTLLEMLPEAAYDENVCVTFLSEGDETKMIAQRDGKYVKDIGKPESFRLELIQKVLPDFFEKVKRERTLDNCTIKTTITWLTPTDCDLTVEVQDNDYVYYKMD